MKFDIEVTKTMYGVEAENVVDAIKSVVKSTSPKWHLDYVKALPENPKVKN